jgi:hypothetical protein
MKTPKDKPLNLKKLTPHPLGAMFPAMSDFEYSDLKKGMKENGFDPKHPVVLYEGRILDGNHRYTASKDTRKTPIFVEFEKLDFAKNRGTAFDFVLQENLRRRNLTPSQAAAIGAEILEQMTAFELAEKARIKEEAKAAKAAGKKKPDEKLGKPVNKARKIAESLNISERSVRKAAALKKSDPEKHEAVKSGEETVASATAQVEQKQSKADREAGVLAHACQIIDGVLGANWSAAHTKHLLSKEIIVMSGIDNNEMVRIKSLIEAGWKLKLAMGYKSTQLSLAHPMRAFVDRSIAQGGVFLWECEAYGKTFEVEIKEKA